MDLTSLYKSLKKYRLDEEAISAILKSNLDLLVISQSKPANYNILNKAIRKSHYIMAVQLIKHGYDFTAIVNNDMPSIVLVIRLKILRLSELMLDMGSTIPFSVASVALLEAAYNGMYETVTRLLTISLNINYKGLDLGNTPLIYAARFNNLDIVKVLIEAGASLDITNNKGETALICAAQNTHGRPTVIKLLLDSGARTDICDKSGKDYRDYLGPAFSFRLHHRKEDSMDGMLEVGTPVDWIYNKAEETLLFQAIDLGKLPIAIMLLDAGANINHQNDNHETPLVYIAKKHYSGHSCLVFESSLPFINLLLERKAIKTIKDKTGNSYGFYIDHILFNAVCDNSAKIISLSIKAGANINFRKKLNEPSLLALAVEKGFLCAANELMLFMKPEDIHRDLRILPPEGKKLKFYKLFRGHLYHLAGLMLFRAFPRDIARAIYDLMLSAHSGPAA